MSEPAITVEGLSKRFRLYHDRNQSLKAAVMRGRRARYEEFWALRDVSLEIAEGVTYGFIGTNGSGKSTLLKCLARILEPDEGSGPHARQGVGPARARRRLPPRAVRPRERVPQRLDPRACRRPSSTAASTTSSSSPGSSGSSTRPVKNYSSGMYVRLGFSVAINVDPDILLVDEVLAVGDEQFQRRCNERFADLRARGPHDRGRVALAGLGAGRSATRSPGSTTACCGPSARPATSSTSTSRRCTRIASAEEPRHRGPGWGPARFGSSGSRCSTATAGPPTTSAPARRSRSGSTTTPRSRSSAPCSRWRSTPSRACCSPSPNTQRGRAVPGPASRAGAPSTSSSTGCRCSPAPTTCRPPSRTTTSLHVYDSPPPRAALRRRARRPPRELRRRRHAAAAAGSTSSTSSSPLLDGC